MNLVKCPNGHFYDAEKYAVCPHCSVGTGDNSMTMPYTTPIPPVDDEPVTMPLTESMDSSGFGNRSQEAATSGVSPNMPQGNNSLGQALRNARNSADMDDDQVTIGLYHQNDKENSVDPTVGWLVCVEGTARGMSYVIRTGRNFIGRGDNMDISIKGDKAISRERHAIILYEPKKRIFIAQAGESRELFYVNDEVVLSSTELFAHDILTLGNTKLMFVPFCGKAFGWDDLDTKEE